MFEDEKRIVRASDRLPNERMDDTCSVVNSGNDPSQLRQTQDVLLLRASAVASSPTTAVFNATAIRAYARRGTLSGQKPY